MSASAIAAAKATAPLLERGLQRNSESNEKSSLVLLGDKTGGKPKPGRMTNISKGEKADWPYKNPRLSTPMRVADLLSRMTLEEKAAQMMCVWQQKAATLVDADGKFDLEKARRGFKRGHGLGQVGRPSDAGSPPAEPWRGQTARGMAELTNAGIISHVRGRVRVVDRQGLEAASCECYKTVRALYDRLLPS